MSWLEIFGIVIGIVTAVFLGGNLCVISRNFRQQRKMDTLNYFSKITPKIITFSEWLSGKENNEPDWLDKLIKDELQPSEKKCYTDKIQSYLSEIELLSIGLFRGKILDEVFIKDFKPQFEYQWEQLKPYIDCTREGNEEPQAWIEMENLIKYLRKKDSKGWIDTMKNLVKNVSPRK